ncbi:MAG: glycoside hydrolase family 16 protein [Peptococcaceae bacterium]|nr:glycoside hydrolase family 16 protein [Peptococcaceae bacterium]
MQDSIGKWYDVEPKLLIIPPKQVVKYDMEWVIPEGALTGDYTMILGLWDKKPGSSSKLLALATLTDSLRIYNTRDNFDIWPQNHWLANDSELGRSTLKSKNVILKNGKLSLKLPSKTLYGAEIQTKEKVHYGSYEIRMKIPEAPSSITGFFLYDQPDYSHEIDIEIYNQAEAYLLLTTYAKGKKAQYDKRILSFNPTSGFHTYRINYFPERVDFFIDDILIKTWSNGFTTEPMYLMVNTWYPKWLEGLSPETDRYLLIDWILK